MLSGSYHRDCQNECGALDVIAMEKAADLHGRMSRVGDLLSKHITVIWPQLHVTELAS